MITKPLELQLLSLSECQWVSDQVQKLKEFWIPDQKGHWEVNSFFTLGVPLYQSTKDIDEYSRSAQSTNAVLLNSLGWLYEIVLERLSKQMGRRIQFNDCLAIPGFHIGLPEFHAQQGGAPHFDLQHRHLERFGFASVVDFGSCTLPVSLPSCGGGIHFYDLNYEKHGRQIGSDDVLMLSGLDVVTFEYAVGQMFFHSGRSCHQIANFGGCASNEMRITLQVHIASCDGDLIAYW